MDQDMALKSNLSRRRFVGTSALTLAAAQFGFLRSKKAEATDEPRATARANTSFGPVKQIEAGLLTWATLKMDHPLVDQ